MDSSSSSRRPSNMYRPVSTSHRDKLLSKQIAPAILDKSCAICLRHIDDRRAAVITACMHAYCIECIRRWSSLKRNCPLCNSHFDSWFFRINLSSRTFRRERLLPLIDEAKTVNRRVDVYERRTHRRFTEQSIYDRHLQALPCTTRRCLKQDVAEKKGAKERILGKIEPWIQRELQAILCDPDPSVIVHVATSLFISSLTDTHRVLSEQSGVADNYLDPLRPFLLERTNTFWHELRCFAESSFNMETYDTVVVYVRRPN